MGLDKFLKALPEDEEASINFASLPELSGLTAPEVSEFGQLWVEWSSDRVLEIVDRMVSLSEEQPDVEFESIFKQGLVHADSRVRARSLKGLEDSGDRTLVGLIIRLMTDDRSDEVRVAAAQSLAHLSALAQAGRLMPRDRRMLTGALFAVLEDESELQAVKLKALEAVSVFGGERIAPHIEWAWSSKNIAARQSSLYAMGRTSNPIWIERIVGDLDHDVASVRYEATVAIGEVGDESHLRVLEATLDDTDLTVQLAAISAVERIGGDRARRLIEQRLTSPEPLVVEAAQLSLETMKEEEDLDEVVTPEMARSMFGTADTLPGIDTEGYDAAEIEGWANVAVDRSQIDDFGTGVTEEAEELGLDRGDPFDIDLPPEDPWDREDYP
ncbi:MAG: HEAT repeat domain-containing protein [Chloroflexi bacterium]|nr:HEAT repeat domain-containing protein [Chloroflexota bacterium]